MHNDKTFPELRDEIHNNSFIQSYKIASQLRGERSVDTAGKNRKVSAPGIEIRFNEKEFNKPRNSDSRYNQIKALEWSIQNALLKINGENEGLEPTEIIITGNQSDNGKTMYDRIILRFDRKEEKLLFANADKIADLFGQEKDHTRPETKAKFALQGKVGETTQEIKL